MATIVLRNVKGSPLTNNEVDNNFTNLNNDKLEISGSSAMTGKLTTVVSSTSTASIRLTQGSGDPSSPVSGDFWNNAGNLKFYDGASVYTLATVTGTQTLTNKTLAAPIITTGLYFEGATEDAYELLLNVVDPTQDRTVTIPDATTTMVGTDVAQTLTNKTLTTPIIEEIDSPANILLDAAADIILDAGGADVILKDDGVEFGKLVNSGGQLAINSGPSSTTAITFSGANVTVVGNLTVSGTTTTVNTETILLADNIITLNSNLSGSTAPSENAGIEINRGSSTAVVFRWNEGTDVWEYTKDGTTYFTLVGLTESQTLTNKTIAAASNTITGLTNTNLSGTAGITNANLANSTISGVALGNTLFGLTIGTGLTGSSYNGSSAVTIAIDTGTVVTLSGSQTLINKSLSDATTFFVDDADNTKKMTFQLSGITSGQIRTLTVPNVSGTIITTGDTGTISNTMLASSSITVNGTIFSLGGSGSITATATNALTIGTGLSLSSGTTYNGSSPVTLTNSGVLSVAGTTNQITASTVSGAVTLSLPQNIHTSANVQFSNLGIGTAASTGVGGDIRATGEITAYYTSDARLKENVVTLSSALDKVTQIRGVTFDWTQEHVDSRGGEDGYFVRKHDVGVIAQEIEAVLPEVVAEREDGFKAVRYEKIVPLLIEAIKELKAEITVLKTTK